MGDKTDLNYYFFFMMPEMLSGVFWNQSLSRVFLRQAHLTANHMRGCSKFSEVCDPVTLYLMLPRGL